MTADRSGGRESILVTGASGYIGKLLAAALLREEDSFLVLPVRNRHTSDTVLAALREELDPAAKDANEEVLQRRVEIVTIPDDGGFEALDEVVARHGIREIVHCAGCLDYFDAASLEAINVEMTRRLLASATRWNISRFVYISTAFSSGYVEGLVPEALHPDPQRDPTDYTTSKRRAEWLVAESGIPFLCVRPSVVIGDSRDGHYVGKQYGIYQLWCGIEQLLCTRWEQEFHAVAPRQPAYLVHQDALQNAFLAARQHLPSGSFINVVSSPEIAPTGPDLWDLWMERCLRPERVYYYDRVDDYPWKLVPRRQRALMALASTNLEIAAHEWRFETSGLDRLLAAGIDYPQATLESVSRCQDVFMQHSERIQGFIEERAWSGRTQHAAGGP